MVRDLNLVPESQQKHQEMQARPPMKGKQGDCTGIMAKDPRSMAEAPLIRKQGSDTSCQVGARGLRARELTRYPRAKRRISVVLCYIY